MITEDYQLKDEVEISEKPKKKHKNHKLISLWQDYLWYNEVVEMRKRHNNRISAIEKGLTQMDKQVEINRMELFDLDSRKRHFGIQMVNSGETAGPIWEWVTSIKGLKSGVLAAQLLAQIDNIALSPTIASLWRFCGYAVFEGKAEPKGSVKAPQDKETGKHYNGKLKGVCFNIAESFIKQQTPVYVDIYYAEKLRQRELHPVAICRKCQIECTIKVSNVKGKEIKTFICPNNGKHVKDFSDQHLHYRGIRKMMKAFLKDLWFEWRKAEGLDIGEKWSG